MNNGQICAVVDARCVVDDAQSKLNSLVALLYNNDSSFELPSIITLRIYKVSPSYVSIRSVAYTHTHDTYYTNMYMFNCCRRQNHNMPEYGCAWFTHMYVCGDIWTHIPRPDHVDSIIVIIITIIACCVHIVCWFV